VVVASTALVSANRIEIVPSCNHRALYPVVPELFIRRNRENWSVVSPPTEERVTWIATSLEVPTAYPKPNREANAVPEPVTWLVLIESPWPNQGAPRTPLALVNVSEKLVGNLVAILLLYLFTYKTSPIGNIFLSQGL
jgi:hypothetical protein